MNKTRTGAEKEPDVRAAEGFRFLLAQSFPNRKVRQTRPALYAQTSPDAKREKRE